MADDSIIRALTERVFLDRRFVLFILNKLPSYISVDKFYQTMNQMEVRLSNSITEESITVIFATIPQLANAILTRTFAKFLLPESLEDCSLFECIPRPSEYKKETF